MITIGSGGLALLLSAGILAPAARCDEGWGGALEAALDVIQLHCVDCHSGDHPSGGLDLERFGDEAAVMRERATWGLVFEKVESGQMPPPKQRSRPSEEDRGVLLDYIRRIAARPDPQLGARDPGQGSACAD